MRTRALLASILLIACADGARAYTGGPEYVEVLGWDPGERRVYCAVRAHNDAGYPAGLVYFPLDSLHQALPTRLAWSRSNRTSDAEHAKRMAALVKRLRPLELVQGPAIPRGSQVLAVDTVRTEFATAPRFRVRLGSPWDANTDGIEVWTLHDPSVSVVRVFAVPGREEKVAVLSFIGDIYGGEEVQVPVLLRRRVPPRIRIEWKPWHPE